MKSILIIFITLSFNSCVIYNSTKNQEIRVCEIHNTKMNKAIVGTVYGKPRYPCINNAFPNAKKKKCMGCLKGPWPNKRLAIVYHCKSCTKAEKIAN